MSAYLAYSYSTRLTKDQQIEIDEKTKKSREEFRKGFVKGASFSLAAYSLYSMVTSAAYAADSNIPATTPKTPRATGLVKPAPTSKPGFKALSETTKGAFAGGATAICGVALNSGDFFLGVACSFLVVVGFIIINRNPD